MKEIVEVVKDGNGWRFMVWEIDETQPKMQIIGNQYVFNTELVVNKFLTAKQLKNV